MYKKTLSLILSCLMLFTLVSCGTQQEETQEEVTISFSWWGDEERYDKTIEAIKLFESKYPYIKVKEQFGEWTGFKKRMNMKIAGNDEPDLMQINYDWLEKYSKDGKGFYDLNKVSDILNLNNFSDEVLSYGLKNGVLNGIPTSMNGKVFYYNNTVNSNFSGGTYETWDDIVAVASKTTDNKYLLAEDAFGSWTLCMSYIDQKTGKNFIDYNGNLEYTQEEIKDLLTFYKTMLDQKVFVSSEVYTTENNMFYANKSAAAIGWITDANKVESKLKAAGAESTVSHIPTIQGKSPIRYVKPATLYTISKNTEHPKEAAMLMNFMLNDTEAAKILGINRGIPCSTSSFNTLKEENMLSGLQYEASKGQDNVRDVLLSPYFENTLVKEICEEAIKQVDLGKAAPEAAAETAYDQLTKTLNTMKVQ